MSFSNLTCADSTQFLNAFSASTVSCVLHPLPSTAVTATAHATRAAVKIAVILAPLISLRANYSHTWVMYLNL